MGEEAMIGTGYGDPRPAARAVQIALLREASPARRYALVRSLSLTAIELSRRAIRRARPGASEQEVSLAFVALHYGTELARKLRRFLEEKHAG